MLGQNSLLERDISKRDSLAGRRRDSVIDPKRAKGSSVPFEQTLQVMKVGLISIFVLSCIELVNRCIEL